MYIYISNIIIVYNQSLARAMLFLNPTLPRQPRCFHCSKRRKRMRPWRKRVQLCCCKLKSCSARAGAFFFVGTFFF